MSDIVCPDCREKLTPADLETYAKCPYCDHLFKIDGYYEDFILSPVLKRWVINTTQRFSR